jgi:hypothetical protein
MPHRATQAEYASDGRDWLQTTFGPRQLSRLATPDEIALRAANSQGLI